MNEFREEVKLQTAWGVTEICQAVGDQITYSDRGETPVTLWCIPGREQRRLDGSGAIQEEHTGREFIIPLQYDSTGTKIFPPDNEPSSAAQITYEGFTWSVNNEGNGFKRDSVGAVYTLFATRHQPRRASA